MEVVKIIVLEEVDNQQVLWSIRESWYSLGDPESRPISLYKYPHLRVEGGQPSLTENTPLKQSFSLVSSL